MPNITDRLWKPNPKDLQTGVILERWFSGTVFASGLSTSLTSGFVLTCPPDRIRIIDGWSWSVQAHTATYATDVFMQAVDSSGSAILWSMYATQNFNTAVGGGAGPLTTYNRLKGTYAPLGAVLYPGEKLVFASSFVDGTATNTQSHQAWGWLVPRGNYG